MQNTDSQRGSETEVIELIANLIASASHHYELYMSLQTDISHTELYTQEQVNQMVEESNWHYNKMLELIEERRKAMRVLKWMAKECDDKLWCICKHSIANYQFSQELRHSDMSNMDYMELAEKASQYMYECISKFLWVKLVTCWRCLKDELED